MLVTHRPVADHDDIEQAHRARLCGALHRLGHDYGQLVATVTAPIRRSAAGSSGAPVPLDVSVHDFLHHPDHEGRPGLIRSLTAAEDITRMALGHTTRPTRTQAGQVPAATCYLAAQLDVILDARWWNQAATAAVLQLGREVLARIDRDRVRLDYDLTRRAAEHRLAQLDTCADTGTGLPAEPVDPDEVEALHADLATSYEEFEERLYGAITARYALAAADAAGWADYLTAEIGRLSARSAALLGVAEHSTAAAADCPWCGEPIGLTRDDPDLAACAGCRRQWRISTGEAAQHFAAWRNAGWSPRPSRDIA